MAIKLVLFDIGGVFIYYPNSFITASTELKTPAEFFDKTFDKYEDALTLGKITPQEMFKLSVAENHLSVDTNYDFAKSWVADYKHVLPAYELAKDLSKAYKIGLFSNIYKDLVPMLITQNFIPNINFTYEFLSCDTGLQKPNLDAYEYVQKTTKLLPHEIFFIDDRTDYLNPAIKFGWANFKFDRENPDISVAQLRDFLL